MEEIVNKVAASGLITIDPEEFYTEGERVVFDMKDRLWKGLALREKEFREFVKEHDWEMYRNKYVAVTCSVDAIVPGWAYMIIASKLQDVAAAFVFGNLEVLEMTLFRDSIDRLPTEEFQDKRLIIKGCSNKPIPTAAYVELVKKLQPLAKSIMFGEACSTVPVFKR